MSKLENNTINLQSILETINNLHEKEITFTIDGKQYSAKNGMCWGEWLFSEYNPVRDLIGTSYAPGSGTYKGEDGSYLLYGDYSTIPPTIKIHRFWFVSGERDFGLNGTGYVTTMDIIIENGNYKSYYSNDSGEPSPF